MYIKTNLKTPIVALVVCGGLGQKYRLVLSHFIRELAIVIGAFGGKTAFLYSVKFPCHKSNNNL